MRNININKLLGVLLFVALVIVIVVRMLYISQPELNGGKNNFSARHSDNDTQMIPERHCGYINFDKFIALVATAGNSNFKESDVVYKGDSVLIRVHNKTLFYGIDDGCFWIDKFANTPIRVTNEGFVAAITTIDSVRYIYMPYQILTSVANYVGGTDDNSNDESLTDISNQTLKSSDKAVLHERLTSSTGKIQTGGYVYQNMCDILSPHPEVEGDKRAQLEVIWRYVRSRWFYVSDPYDVNEVWRSASETIQTYYNIEGKQYYGDCDDFAILMASFARQIGFRSHIVTAYNNQDKGHAYAEFQDEDGNWIPLDWFSNVFGGEPFDGIIDHVYENI